MTTLYRAHPEEGVKAIAGVTSWTTSKEHALKYAAGRFHGFGGPNLYVAEVDPAGLLDLRPHDGYPVIRDELLALGICDLDNYAQGRGYLHELFREAAEVVRAHGYAWLAFCDERPVSDDDEWLYLGADPVPVRACKP
ncbi:hypothetical protein ACWEU6_37070 [Streptosporangium sandarakinum]|uniref:hypothetical protein n=1 Tax=Streptosporangium sandarakinum TaxID=1260955 RepID=UPI0036C970C1